MAVHCIEHNISYFEVPKCASSSLKDLFYRIENGREFVPYVTKSGRRVHIHNVYPTRPFEEESARRPAGAWTFAVVRDPIQRIISCYKNRVRTGPTSIMLRKNKKKVEALGLSAEPSLDEFVSSLEAYRDFALDIRWHSDPLCFFLGRDPRFFDSIFDLSELGSCYDAIAGRVGDMPPLPHLQRRGEHVNAGFMSANSIRIVRDTFEEDYEVFGAYFVDNETKHPVPAKYRTQ